MRDDQTTAGSFLLLGEGPVLLALAAKLNGAVTLEGVDELLVFVNSNLVVAV